MKRLLILVLLLVLVPLPHARAQSGVWVTTQDYVSLRAGPGEDFDRIAVIDPAVTLPAVGRSSRSNWIQVEYEGQRGWLYAGLLVWSGDVSSLPVDGVEPAAFIRRATVQGITSRETPLYRHDFGPGDYVGMLPERVDVELVGRLGYNTQGFYRLQIFHEGQMYWVGAWNIRITAGDPERLMDMSYLYPYGRLALVLETDIMHNTSALARIEDIWLRLGSGSAVSCASIPAYARRAATDTDVAYEPVFQPLVASLDAGINSINAATSRFEDACLRPDSFLTQQDVTNALADIENARRNLNIASSLLVSLQVRDPLIGERR